MSTSIRPLYDAASAMDRTARPLAALMLPEGRRVKNRFQMHVRVVGRGRAPPPCQIAVADDADLHCVAPFLYINGEKIRNHERRGIVQE
jgi:hypothetical protein